jgi:hypothetical protein
MSMQDERVEAGLRRSLTCRSRLWSLDAFDENLGDIKQALDRGESRRLKWDLQGSFDRSVQTARKCVEQQMQVQLEAEFRRHFTGSDLEVPCKMLLEALYPAADVERVAGPGEHGADLIVTFEDPLVRSGFPSAIGWRAVFQVKDWRGEAADTHALEQLAQAAQEYAKEGLPVRGAFVMCFCDGESGGFRTRRDELSGALGVPVGFVGKRQLLGLFGDMALGRKIG